VPKITTDEFNRIVAEELPLARGLGVRLEAIERGRSVIRIPYDDALLRPGGTVAGPVMMAAADAAMYAAIMSELGTVKQAVTTNLNINFLRRPGPGDIIAEGRVLKLGRRLAVLEVTIRSDGSDAPVAHATGTYSIPPAAD
jgi:uncharacterized protein (TIGR00369 family)